MCVDTRIVSRATVMTFIHLEADGVHKQMGFSKRQCQGPFSHLPFYFKLVVVVVELGAWRLLSISKAPNPLGSHNLWPTPGDGQDQIPGAT